MTWVGRGVISLINGEFDRAGENFDNALATSEEHIPAMLGKARMFFNDGKYDNALQNLCRSEGRIEYASPVNPFTCESKSTVF